MFGLLNINKPSGITSRGVVDAVQRIVRPAKAGHAGTLDPLASGVLIVCTGAATRLIDYVQRMPKRYTGTFLLGRRSETEDIEGDVVELDDPPQPTREQIEDILPRFLGQIEQRPPAFSAKKIGGKRAYKLARQGKQVELPPNKIRVDEIRLAAYDYPELTLDIVCGSGTYIRSLGRDIARALQTEAVMSALVRSAIGEFRVEEACSLDDLSPETIGELLLPARSAVRALPAVEVTGDEIRLLVSGRTIENRTGAIGEEIAAMDATGRLVAILAPAEVHRLRPVRNFPRGE